MVIANLLLVTAEFSERVRARLKLRGQISQGYELLMIFKGRYLAGNTN